MKIITVLMGTLSVPIMLMNFFGGLIGAIWLGVIGEWNILLIGGGILLAGALLCSLILMPGIAVSAACMAAWERAGLLRILLAPFMVCGGLWTYVVMAAWGFGAFLLMFSGVPSPDDALPHALWAYAIGTSPWTYMMQKDLQAGNDHGVIPLFFLQLGCICLVLAFGLQLPALIAAFWGIMALSVIIGLVQLISAITSAAKSAEF